MKDGGKSMAEKSGFREKMRKVAEKDMETIRKFLMDCVTGEEKETVITKEGGEVKVPLCGKDRIAAAKVYKEAIASKVMPDVKEAPQKGQSAHDISKGIEEVAKQKKEQAEKRAIEAGKLRRMKRA